MTLSLSLGQVPAMTLSLSLGQVPAEWHAWLHHMTDRVPAQMTKSVVPGGGGAAARDAVLKPSQFMARVARRGANLGSFRCLAFSLSLSVS